MRFVAFANGVPSRILNTASSSIVLPKRKIVGEAVRSESTPSSAQI